MTVWYNQKHYRSKLVFTLTQWQSVFCFLNNSVINKPSLTSFFSTNTTVSEKKEPRFGRILRPSACKQSGTTLVGKRGRDGQKKKICKADDKMKRGKVKRAKDEEVNEQGERGGKEMPRAHMGHIIHTISSGSNAEYKVWEAFTFFYLSFLQRSVQ